MHESPPSQQLLPTTDEVSFSGLSDLVFLAIGGLLIDIAGADHKIHRYELQQIKDVLVNHAHVSETKAELIIQQSINLTKQGDFDKNHLAIINSNLDKAQKVKLLECMLRVTIADGFFYDEERVQVTKLATSLGFSFDEMIEIIAKADVAF